MISWWWLIPAFVCGGVVGFFIVLYLFAGAIRSSWY